MKNKTKDTLRVCLVIIVAIVFIFELVLTNELFRLERKINNVNNRITDMEVANMVEQGLTNGEY